MSIRETYRPDGRKKDVRAGGNVGLAREEVSMGRRYERLTTPMVRVDGKLQATDWHTALAAAAAGFERTPGTATGMFSCSKATNEMNFIAEKFARTVLSTNNIDSCNRT
jgi:predicted molibdopterin-dependent oxidoreductase YjgC